MHCVNMIPIFLFSNLPRKIFTAPQFSKQTISLQINPDYKKIPFPLTFPIITYVFQNLVSAFGLDFKPISLSIKVILPCHANRTLPKDLKTTEQICFLWPPASNCMGSDVETVTPAHNVFTTLWFIAMLNRTALQLQDRVIWSATVSQTKYTVYYTKIFIRDICTVCNFVH